MSYDATLNRLSFYFEADGLTDQPPFNQFRDTPLRIASVETLRAGTDEPKEPVGPIYPGGWEFRGRSAPVGTSARNLSAGTAAPSTAALLLPAVQKVREAARRSVKFEPFTMGQARSASQPYPVKFKGPSLPSSSTGSREVPASGIGWSLQILPYIEQENLHKLQSIVRGGGGGAMAIVATKIIDKASSNMFRDSDRLVASATLRSASGGFRARLEQLLVRVVENEPTILVGFSASRLG